MNLPLQGLYYYNYKTRQPQKKFNWIWIILIILLLAFMLSGVAKGEPEVCISCIITIESNGNPNAYNKKSGARGLMQITPIVYAEYCEIEYKKWDLEELFNPEFNQEIGKWYLDRIENHYLKGKGTITDILVCYRDGYGNWKKWKQGKHKLGKEMKAYLKKYFALAKEKETRNCIKGCVESYICGDSNCNSVIEDCEKSCKD